jgi:hypothetical protein
VTELSTDEPADESNRPAATHTGEHHHGSLDERLNWRAGVLGAHDGIMSVPAWSSGSRAPHQSGGRSWWPECNSGVDDLTELIHYHASHHNYDDATNIAHQACDWLVRRSGWRRCSPRSSRSSPPTIPTVGRHVMSAHAADGSQPCAMPSFGERWERAVGATWEPHSALNRSKRLPNCAQQTQLTCRSPVPADQRTS